MALLPGVSHVPNPQLSRLDRSGSLIRVGITGKPATQKGAIFIWIADGGKGWHMAFSLKMMASVGSNQEKNTSFLAWDCGYGWG